jgi:hypothetical protein
MTTIHPNINETKRRLVRLCIDDLAATYKPSDEDSVAEKLIDVLSCYEYALNLEFLQTPVTIWDLDQIMDAIRGSKHLLGLITENGPEEMRDWSHGVTPANESQAWANALSRISLELQIIVGEFGLRAPQLKQRLEAARARRAEAGQ